MGPAGGAIAAQRVTRSTKTKPAHR